MGISPFLKNEQLESFRLKLGRVFAIVTFNANTSTSSISVSSNNAGVKVYTKIAAAQPTVAAADDTQTNFGTLDYATAPTTIGILVLCRDAAEFYNAVGTLCQCTTTMTGFTSTKAGSSTTGVTALNSNLAVVGSLTGLDGDAQISTTIFQLELFYRKV